MKIRLTATVLCIAFALLLAACGGQGDFTLPTEDTVSENHTSGSYTYSIYDDGTVKLTAYTPPAGVVETALTVPDTLDGRRVTALGDGLYADNEDIISVVIGDGITSIESGAFFDCKSLVSVKIGKNVTSVGGSAFLLTPWYESLSDEFVMVGDGVLLRYNGTEEVVVIPDNVKHLSDAFRYNDRIRRVEMGDNLLTIGEGAFCDCVSLSDVVFGSNILSIGPSAFNACVSLSRLEIPDSVQRIGAEAFTNCVGLLGVKLGKGVTEIGDMAFYYCGAMKEIYLPVSLARVGENAFADCGSMRLVLFGGTQAQYEAIGIPDSNQLLTDAYTIYGVEY